MGLDPENVRRSYDAVAEHYAAALLHELDGKPLDRALLTVLVDDVADHGGGPIADIGSGPGHVAKLLGQMGATSLVVDLSPAMVGIAQRELKLAGAAASMTHLPLETASLGGAVVFYSLIHLDDEGLVAAASELGRVLRPDAPVLVSFHAGDEVLHRDEWWGESVDVDFRFLTTDQVGDHLEQAGLRVEAVLQRTAYPDEANTRRGYLLARR